MSSSLLDEQWNGSPEEELESFVSELCYIHRSVEFRSCLVLGNEFRLLQQIHVCR